MKRKISRRSFASAQDKTRNDMRVDSRLRISGKTDSEVDSLILNRTKGKCQRGLMPKLVQKQLPVRGTDATSVGRYKIGVAIR